MAFISPVGLPLDSFVSYFQNIHISAPQRIQALFQRIAVQSSGPDVEIQALFKRCLGFSAQEESAMTKYKHLICQLEKPGVTILPTDRAGTYDITIKGKLVARFLTGVLNEEKRRCIATLAALLGFEGFVTPGIPCVLNQVSIPTEAPQETLWNGMIKQYHPNTIAPHLIGSLELIDSPDRVPSPTPFKLVVLTLIAAIAGFREVSDDAFVCNATRLQLSEVEGAFSASPSLGSTRTAFYFLDLWQELANAPITSDELAALKRTVTAWESHKIVEILKERHILFADLPLEKLSQKTQAQDAAGCSVNIGMQDPDCTMKKRVLSQPPYCVLHAEDRKHVKAAIASLKKIILKAENPFSAETLVRAFDPRYAQVADFIKQSPITKELLGGSHALCARPLDDLRAFGFITPVAVASLSTPGSPQRNLSSAAGAFPLTVAEGEPRTPSPIPGPKDMASPPGVHRPTPVHSSPQRSERTTPQRSSETGSGEES